MNRLVRIALTLFVSATVMIFLVLRRLEKAKEIAAIDDESLSAYAGNEIHMAYFGLGIAGVMLLGGVALLTTAFLHSRKKPAGHG